MRKPFEIAGAYTALVTPFTEDGNQLDIAALEALIQSQIKGGIDGLVPCGTTGETPTLTDTEYLEVIRRTVTLAAGRIPVIAGAGANSTQKTIKTAQAALEAGADGLLIVTPYYNKPSQEGLYQHFTTVAREVGGAPIVLYNIPARSVIDLSMDTLARICEAVPNIVAVKDATGNIVRCQHMVQRFGNALSVMCGDDALTLGMMACGAKGVISVTSNLYPEKVAQVCHLIREGQWEKARRLHLALVRVHDSMFIEPNPAPVKAALAMKGRIRPALRLPLVPPTDSTRKQVAEALRAFEAELGE